MFDSILIANRGEIAVRIARTARRLGVRTVAVYSEADARALHVDDCDDAVCIGPPPAGASYLRSDAIIAAARARGAQAIHPGYGFLSENAGFAAQCAQAGLVFIGPPVAAIEAMGSKSESKRIVGAAGVPLVPGYHGEDQADERFVAEAGRIGLPVLVKASAGGGGRGMRIVRDAAELIEGLAACRREARSAFGDDRLLLERYVERARHVEVQVFADTHGGCLHLYERDCSMQRRHQKVIEEAPAPRLPAALRARLCDAAVAAARAVGYVGAGTVEFVLDGDDCYFIEMNTRLQVEHPVTEAITGFDLVEWQLRVASGERLPVEQSAVVPRGHAIEVRLCAEDPRQSFRPSSGRIDVLRLPVSGTGVRVDTGVREGDDIPPYYDSMIAKLIVHGATREDALRQLRQALAQSAVVGPQTNLELLGALAAAPEFAAGHYDTGFIERSLSHLLPATEDDADDALVLAALVLAERLRPRTDEGGAWDVADGWRPNLPARIRSRLSVGAPSRDVVLQTEDGRRSVSIDDGPGRVIEQVRVREDARRVEAVAGGRKLAAWYACAAGQVAIGGTRGTVTVRRADALRAGDARTAGEGRLVAPLPGVVSVVLVAPGARVERDAPLVVVEAMKMEHTLRARAAGRVAEVRCVAGDRVEEGVELVVVEPEGEPAAAAMTGDPAP